jgi:hypothetical protein
LCPVKAKEHGKEANAGKGYRDGFAGLMIDK